ncbi:MAG: NADH:flavin oxidoreductase, partial [Eubacteriales bacterium]|nr:NADH:flavin oxidoreductase [Eubacteriales bacterium]
MVCDLTNAAGEATQAYIDFVEMQSSTRAGLITLGATPVDRVTGTDYPHELDITDDGKITGLRQLAEAAHLYGAKLSVELVHAGRGAHPDLLKTDYALAPSNIPIPSQMQYIKEMDQHDIEHVVACYADCALRIYRCGFDAVMIHCAHGNLLAQFLSPLTNKRSDIYGGSLDNRAKVPLMVLRAVREAVGPKCAIEMRISGDEIVKGGMRINETIEFIKMAQEYIDLVHVSAGLIVDWRTQYYTMPPYYLPRGANVPYAHAIKQCPDIHIPVATVGGIVTIAQADEIIDSGSADICAMARALLCDPELIKKSYRGEPETARPCLRCFYCNGEYGGHITCAVNPALGRKEKYATVMPANKKK